MSTNGWTEVSKTRPCTVCSKPDWCSYADDGHAVICRRIRTDGAIERGDKNGSSYYVYVNKDAPDYGSNGTWTVSTYDYLDLNGYVLYQKVIKRSPGKKKESFFQRPHPAHPGMFIQDLKGIKPVLYNLPGIVKARQEQSIVGVVEGEKCCQTLQSMGITGTTAPFGSGSWNDAYSEALRGLDVVVIPDADGAGEGYARKVIKSLQGVAKSVRRIDLPGLGPKEDVYDWREKGGTPEQLDQLIAHAERIGDQPDDTSPWSGIQRLPEFLADRVDMPEGIAHDLLYPGGVTVIAAPAGLGKSVVAHIVARELASGGIYRGQKLAKARVLIVDTDNPKSLVQKRLSKVCNEHDIDLDIITREKVRPLSDAAFWKALPAPSYDVVIVDSFGGATPGVSEKESAQSQHALHTIRGVADRGPAVLVLDNTVKNGDNYRGRGEKAERVDIVYEVRDVTGWEPTMEDWWLRLPDSGDKAWQERASRRKQTPQIRLAFVARKFRWDAEPQPFVLEVSFDTDPWSFEDVTAEIEAMAKFAVKEQRQDTLNRQLFAVETMAIEIKRRYEANEPVIGKREAEDFLYDQGDGLTRRVIRALIHSHDANVYPQDGRWRIQNIPESHGNKKGLFYLCENAWAKDPQSGTPYKNNEFVFSSFAHPHNPWVGKRLHFSVIENKGVIPTIFCPRDFGVQKDFQPIDPVTPIKSMEGVCTGLSYSDDAAQHEHQKTHGQKIEPITPIKSIAENGNLLPTQEICGWAKDEFSAHVKTIGYRTGSFAHEKSTQEDNDDLDLMIGQPKYARPPDRIGPNRTAKGDDMENTMEWLDRLILERVSRYDFVSFAELLRLEMPDDLAAFVEASPEQYLGGGIRNVWIGFGKVPVLDAVERLLDANQVYLEPCSPWVYMLDGHRPDMPLAKRVPENGYKTPRWFPCVIRPGRWPDPKTRQKPQPPGG